MPESVRDRFCVSIHARVRRATLPPVYGQSEATKFQFTPAYGERPDVVDDLTTGGTFQFTPAYGERQAANQRSNGIQEEFQFTPAYGERPAFPENYSGSFAVSIHARVRRATSVILTAFI